MGNILFINASPRGAQSNSKKYIEVLKNHISHATVCIMIDKQKQKWIQTVKQYTDVVFVFPLYADGIPARMLELLKELESQWNTQTTIHIIVNCGFLEWEQNRVAVEQVQYYCTKQNLNMGMILCIGSGEAILKTPFAYFAKRKIKQFAKGILQQKKQKLFVSMPISKNMFLRASTKYWIAYGAKYGTTKQQMQTMKIE